MKRQLLGALMLVSLLLGGCAAQPSPDAGAVPEAVTMDEYAIVVKDVSNPYMIRMYEGFSEACAELGVASRMLGPDPNGETTQAEFIHRLIDEGVRAIAIAANDSSSVSEALQAAIDAGIAVVSLDSTVDPADRMVHIQQASPEMIGRVLIQAGAQMIGGAGDVAILTTTSSMPNQVSWVNWMTYELAHYADKYEHINLVEVAYGMDESTPSKAQARSLIKRYPGLKLIIAPTTMGLRAAAETVTELNSAVKVTGLGLPSEMEPFIVSGVCPWMYLWNPTEVGYLAAYASHALLSGEITGQIDEILSAGSLGDKVVTRCEDGGSEIVLGNPKMFDNTNIAMWKEVL